MNTTRLASLLLLSTALATPAMAQDADTTGDATVAAQDGLADEGPEEGEAPEVSLPGEIVVTGRRSRDLVRTAPQVVSVLSSEQIARTGEGDIAGSLSRVTGLSVVGKGYVYVRGLGDRYSLALLNGSPLPSPEPLKRVVPLDLFPSSVIASSLVQKTYSANFPGEFGGGVINLTTKAAPRDGFFELKLGASYDSETTGQLGYTYFGSGSDWTGFDDGTRDVPAPLQAFFDSRERLSAGNVDTAPIAKALVNQNNSILQRYENLPANFSGGLTAGKSFDVGEATVGVIANFGYSNKWSSRGAINQYSLDSDLSTLQSDFYRISTDNRIVVNGLLGFGLEAGDSKVRWTNLFIRDTVKSARLSEGSRNQTIATYRRQNTGWYERQLLNSQIVAEMKPADGLSLDLRAGYANSQREAPYELSFEYARTNDPADPYGNYFVNVLDNGQRGDAEVSFSDLNEDLWSGSVDLSYELSASMVGTIGYSYADTRRTSSRRDFKFTAPTDFPLGVGMLRPDLLLGDAIIDYFDIELIETNEGNPAFVATLVNHAGYGKINAQLGDAFEIDAGVRYETAKEVVTPLVVFNTPGASTASTNLDNDYWLPTATVTWNVTPDMKLRFNASKTIARPQFRELLFQFYFDPDSNREYRGNPSLTDSKLTNAEVRYEWYFAPEQRFSLAGFYKKIDKPIESFITGTDLVTSFANAPSADLYGVELELQKHFDVFASRRIVAGINYTWSESQLNVKDGDPVAVYPASSTNAADFFRDGAPLTGQSKHIGNVQLSLEDRDSLSQQTLLLTYASKRVVSRGLSNANQPDVIENPGLVVDFVARQGIAMFGLDTEWKFEARNIFAKKHEEYQQFGDNRVDQNTYDVGRVMALSATVKM
ncbi:TonB-dependent receptor domain-containing protein [Croceicoccus sp. BE223]|uniref:TonB-dependent receptor domain-containing protein n=1 Tax=Croceicoccus sp. BE223 TaxID=2817716 RepID=UPI00286790B4|nr:TonB-dependent receptor [Croceicoccus sp. BE223]MDR7101930.1 TonB-dependent receptor [Croceicoccus sp. BE223]